MMDLYVETLTGTAFELRVSPFETILAVKNKIQRFEGIPTSQQHLIWQNTELADDYCLRDYNIHNGATLKLVLSMRGGPINTRRIPMDDSSTLRDMADYADSGKESRQVTLLVFKEGNQVNFFRVVDRMDRVVDRGDGTMTPLTEPLSTPTVCNQYEEEEAMDAALREENARMKGKMQVLKTKMDSASKKGKLTAVRSTEGSTMTSASSVATDIGPPLCSTGQPGPDKPNVHEVCEDYGRMATVGSAGAKTCLPPVTGGSSGKVTRGRNHLAGYSLPDGQGQGHSAGSHRLDNSTPLSGQMRTTLPLHSAETVLSGHGGEGARSSAGSSAKQRVRRRLSVGPHRNLRHLDSSMSNLALEDSLDTFPVSANALEGGEGSGVIACSTTADASCAAVGAHGVSSPPSPRLATSSGVSSSAGPGPRTLTQSAGHSYSFGGPAASSVGQGGSVRKKDLALDTIKESLKSPLSPPTRMRTPAATETGAPGDQPSAVASKGAANAAGGSSGAVASRGGAYARLAAATGGERHDPLGSSVNPHHYHQRHHHHHHHHASGVSGAAGSSSGSGHHHYRHHQSRQRGSGGGGSSGAHHHHHHVAPRLELESLSPSEAQTMTDLLNQASFERLGSSRIGHLYSGGGAAGTAENLQSAAGGSSPVKPVQTRGTSAAAPPRHRHYHATVDRIMTPNSRLLSARLLDRQEDRLLMSEGPSNEGLPAQGGLGATAKLPLPPVTTKKKASSRRCFTCSKKTGLATSYLCRCGHNFCSVHRYAEAHDCTFDYKTEGRKILEQNNPVISAPKLPKI